MAAMGKVRANLLYDLHFKIPNPTKPNEIPQHQYSSAFINTTISTKPSILQNPTIQTPLNQKKQASLDFKTPPQDLKAKFSTEYRHQATNNPSPSDDHHSVTSQHSPVDIQITEYDRKLEEIKIGLNAISDIIQLNQKIKTSAKETNDTNPQQIIATTNPLQTSTNLKKKNNFFATVAYAKQFQSQLALIKSQLDTTVSTIWVLEQHTGKATAIMN
eukprot:jgi/Psemu1/3748/gm1.3748_g